MGSSFIPAARRRVAQPDCQPGPGCRRVASSNTRSESMPGFLPGVPAGGNLLQVRVPAVS